MDKPKSLRVVFIGGADAVAVLYLGALPLGVIVDVGDERRPYQLAVCLLALQIGVHALEQFGLIVGRTDDALVGRGQQSWPVECVVERTAGITFGFQRHSG